MMGRELPIDKSTCPSKHYANNIFEKTMKIKMQYEEKKDVLYNEPRHSILNSTH